MFTGAGERLFRRNVVAPTCRSIGQPGTGRRDAAPAGSVAEHEADGLVFAAQGLAT